MKIQGTSRQIPEDETLLITVQFHSEAIGDQILNYQCCSKLRVCSHIWNVQSQIQAVHVQHLISGTENFRIALIKRTVVPYIIIQRSDNDPELSKESSIR